MPDLMKDEILRAFEVLKNGGVILYPTDTVWGLGCDATNQSAVQKIFKIKTRAEGKSLIVLVNGAAMLERYIKYVPGIAYEITGVSDSPVTIIYPDGKNLAAGVCSEDGSVGIRICNEVFCSELISRFRRPIVSTSANLSGNPLPSNFNEIEEVLIKSADYIVKYRQDDRRKYSASPVIKIDKNGVFKILRI